MAGDDEAKARASLVAMMERISRGPYAALGVTHTATHEQVRGAFLQLTKRFHPAKFARMSTELQKLSNEVFLGIKAAHDLLAHGSALRGTPASAKGSAPQPMLKPAEGSTSMRPQTGALPKVGSPPTGPQPSLPKPGSPPAQPPASPPAPPAPPAPARPATAAQPPLAKPTGNGRPPTPPTGVLAAGTTVQRKDPTPASPTPNPAVAGAPAAARGTTTQPAVAGDERTALEQAMQLVKAKNWSAARQALHNLVGRAPQTTQYRALLCYVRGRESHAAGRVDDARIEYERALQLDPELALAKQAVVELLRRR